MERITSLGNKDTRSGFGAGLHIAGKADERIVALCADLMGSLKMDAFARDFPLRYIECGIAEANMMGVAAGLAVGGLIPFAGTFAAFATGRVYDQIRQSIAYSQTNVKICASHAGITLGEDGATHRASALRLQSDHRSHPCSREPRGPGVPTFRASFRAQLHRGG